MVTSIYNKELWTSGCSESDPVCTLSSRPSPFFVDSGRCITSSIVCLRQNTKLLGIDDTEYITSLEGIDSAVPKQCQFLAPDKKLPVILANNRHQYAYWAMIPSGDRHLLINVRFWTHCLGVIGGKVMLVRRHNSYDIDIKTADDGCGVFWGNKRLSLDKENLVWSDALTDQATNTFVVVPTGKSFNIDIDLDPYDMSQFFNSSVLVTSMINGRRYTIESKEKDVYLRFYEDISEYKEWTIQSSSWTNENNVLYEVIIKDDGNYIDGDIKKNDGTLYLAKEESSFYLLILPDRQVGLLKVFDNSLVTVVVKENNIQTCVLHRTIIATNWTFSGMKEYIPILFNLDPRI